ncbi:MAG TPA: hypothetical protein VEJ46_05995 [Candidatus Acidoferrum sp.]|nr:hypothetical protein [Candidatus Acidoferrum sp.]
MAQRPRQREKSLRAFAAYLELVDTADWIRRKLRRPLESFGLTLEEVRLLFMLFPHQQLSTSEFARQRVRDRANLRVTFLSLERRGLVHRKVVTLPPAETRPSRLPKHKRDQPRIGRRVCTVSLTRNGAAFMRRVLPRHVKLVKALMRVLSYREQWTLMRLCCTLREGYIVRFMREIRMEDDDQDLLP